MRIILLKSFLLISLLSLGLGAMANPVEYKACSPASGSEITSFDFELEFDITKALQAAAEAAPGVNVGLGCKGSAIPDHDFGQAVLYRGDEETGEIIGLALTSDHSGKTEGFVVNGNKLRVKFDDNIPVVNGEQYTVKITNRFYLFKEGKATYVTSTKADFHDNPIILKFIGGSVGDSKIYMESCSVESGSTLDKLKTVMYRFSNPFTIAPDAQLYVKEGDDIVASTGNLSVSLEDPQTLVAEFAEEVLLLNPRSYTLTLPAGAVAHANNSAAMNSPITAELTGSYKYVVPFLTSKVEINSNGLPQSVTFLYDLPEGTSLEPKILYIDHSVGLLQMEGSEESVRFTDVVYVENGRGMKWDLSKYSFNPSATYHFKKDGSTIFVWDTVNKYEWDSQAWLRHYTGEDGDCSFSVPTIEEMGFTPITIGTPKIGKHDAETTPDFVEGGRYESIDVLEMARIDYEYNGKQQTPTLKQDDHDAVIYDVTDGTRKFVKTASLYSATRGGTYDNGVLYGGYGVFTLHAKMKFLEGRTYELVIPQGTIILKGNPQVQNFITNPEIVYTVKGASPIDFTVESCSAEDGQEGNVVPPAITWTIDGMYELKDSNFKAEGTYSGTLGGKLSLPVSLIQQDGLKTYLTVHLVDLTTGEQRALRNGGNLTVTIQEGSLVYPVDHSIFNPEISSTFVGAEPVDPSTNLNVDITINGLLSTRQACAYGKSFSLTLNTEPNWKVESVKQGSKNLMFMNGKYSTMPLMADTELVATIVYDGPWATEVTTDVWEIEADAITICRDGDHIVVDGVVSGQTIAVYNVGGLLVNTMKADVAGGDKGTVRISVAPGQTYIVTVDGTAAKLRM